MGGGGPSTAPDCPNRPRTVTIRTGAVRRCTTGADCRYDVCTVSISVQTAFSPPRQGWL